MEHIVIGNLPAGTKAKLQARAERHRRSSEAEARAILVESLDRPPVALVDLLTTGEGAGIDFQPERLDLVVRPADL